MNQTAAAPTAVMANDIASAVATSLTHSQIVKVQFQPAQLPRCQFWGMGNTLLDAVAHGATHFTGNASYREQLHIAPTESASVPTDNT